MRVSVYVVYLPTNTFCCISVIQPDFNINLKYSRINFQNFKYNVILQITMSENCISLLHPFRRMFFVNDAIYLSLYLCLVQNKNERWLNDGKKGKIFSMDRRMNEWMKILNIPWETIYQNPMQDFPSFFFLFI